MLCIPTCKQVNMQPKWALSTIAHMYIHYTICTHTSSDGGGVKLTEEAGREAGVVVAVMVGWCCGVTNYNIIL